MLLEGTNMQPTPEQAAIIAAARDTDANLLVSALAGAAKTSTLVLIGEALPETEILALAFNKKMANDLQARLPSNCKAMTLNALGHRTWSDATGRRLTINTSKTFEIVNELVRAAPRADQDILWENFAELIRIVDFGKACGYIPTDHYEKAKRLMDDSEFFGHLEQRLSDTEIDLVREATLTSLALAFKGTCDFNDQILMPTVFHGAFPRYPLVLVDEAQDLSALNHATLRKLAKRRLICVGDPCQAIYGFRGAHEESMALLRDEFSMRELPLTISFRCPQEVVKHVRWRAPQMRWPEWAQPGTVTTLAQWDAASLPEDATIICRNNSPLFNIAIRLLKNGRTCELHGKDIVAAITKVMRKFGGHDLPQHAVLEKIDAWLEVEKGKNKPSAFNRLEDRAECMRVFAREGETLGDALAYAQHLTQLHSPLKLMTGHGSKGLEFDHVYFLDQSLVGKEDQEPNLRYVIATRAKQTLTYIRSEDFVDQAKELQDVCN
jgi:DNA helicase-2/ATP-dependent DNA helicase PcrA